MSTVGRRQQKNLYCLLLFIIVVACATAKMENDFVLQMFLKAVSEEGLKKYHNKWLLESSIVKIMNAHYDMYESLTVDCFHKALRLSKKGLLCQNNLADIDYHNLNTSDIFRVTHHPYHQPRVDIYYLHHDGNYDATTLSSQENCRLSRCRQTTTTTDDGNNNNNKGQRICRKTDVENNLNGTVNSLNPDWYANLVNFDKSLQFDSGSFDMFPVPESVSEIQAELKKKRNFKKKR